MSRLVPAAILVIVLALAGCGGSKVNDQQGTQVSTSAKQASPGPSNPKAVAGKKLNEQGTVDVTERTALGVQLGDFFFRPTILEGIAGQRISLQLRNTGKVKHNLSIPSQKIDKDVAPGKTYALTVTFPRSGSLVFLCKYHAAQNMRGALKVGTSRPGTGRSGLGAPRKRSRSGSGTGRSGGASPY